MFSRKKSLTYLLNTQSMKLVFSYVILLVLMCSTFFVYYMRSTVLSSASDFSNQGDYIFHSLQRELGHSDPENINLYFNYLEKRFSFKYEYKTSAFNFNTCKVHKKLESPIERIDLCFNNLKTFHVVKKIDTLRGIVFLIFSKEIEYSGVLVYIKVILLFLIMFLIMFFSYLRTVNNLLIKPINKIHGYLNSTEKITQEFQSSEYNDLIYLIKTNRKSLKNRSIALTIERIGHDVYKPFDMLNKVLTNLKSFGGTRDSLNSYINKVTPQIKRATETAEGMLSNLADITQETQINKEKTNLKSVINDVLSLFDFSKDELNLQIKHKNNIEIDHKKIVRAITNLVANAKTYANKKVWIRTAELDLGQEIIIGNDGDQVQQEDNIFDLFFRLGSSGGKGLGLTTTKNFVVAHDGNISLLSNQKNNVEFKIYLPF